VIISDIHEIEGRLFPARRRTRPLAGDGTTIPTETFSVGYVTIEPDGGQVPWHNQDMEEIYVVIEGSGEMCLGEERQTVKAGQAIFIPPGTYHQLTNLGDEKLIMMYVCAAGFVAHPQQEMDGTLPKAGVGVPSLPEGSHPQHTDPPQ
jgi:mannose-6-phosphate isomerase-like protein (cupin superfamily)